MEANPGGSEPAPVTGLLRSRVKGTILPKTVIFPLCAVGQTADGSQKEPGVDWTA